jgi:hypothetical protein
VKIGHLRTWVLAHLVDAQSTLPNVRPDFEARVIAGRRERLTDDERTMLSTKYDSLQERIEKAYRGRVQTYDNLSEHAIGVSKERSTGL